MKNIFALIGLSLIFYFILFYMIKIKKIKCENNHFKIIIPILTILSIANNLLSIKYNFIINNHFLILQNLLLIVTIPIYYIYLKFNIKLSKWIELLFILCSIILFLKVIIVSGVQSITFPLIYLALEFIHANNISNVKKMRFKFSISYIDLFNKLSLSDKVKYREILIKTVTVLFSIITMTMITISKTGFTYQIMFIAFISFMFIHNIRVGKIKNSFIKNKI